MKNAPESPARLFSRMPVIGWLIVLSLCLRLMLPLAAYAHTGDAAIFLGPDTNSYITPARELLATGRFTAHGEPDVFRTPGYPLLLLPGLACGHLITLTIVLQAILSSLTVYLLYRLAQLVYAERVARWAALLYAIEPLSIFYVAKLLSETLFTFALLLFLYLFLRYTRERSLNLLLWSAVILAASAYIRPVSYYLPLYTALIFGLLFISGHEKKLLWHYALFLIVSLGPLKLWQIRNQVTSGYGGFSVVSAKNLFFYNGAAVAAKLEHRSYSETRLHLWETYGKPALDAPPEQRAAFYEDWERQGQALIAGHPLLYARIHLKGIVRLLADPGATAYLKIFKLYPETGGNLLSLLVDQGAFTAMKDLFRHQPLVFWSNLLFGVLLGGYYVLTGIAFSAVRFWRERGTLILGLFAAYFLAVSGGPVGFHRYRHPLMPFFALWAGYGLAMIAARLSRVPAEGSAQ